MFYIAAIAREKLESEAAMQDRDLRRIVHHALLYDALSQKCYFSEATVQTVEKVKAAPPKESAVRHVELAKRDCEVAVVDDVDEGYGSDESSEGEGVKIEVVELVEEVD